MAGLSCGVASVAARVVTESIHSTRKHLSRSAAHPRNGFFVSVEQAVCWSENNHAAHFTGLPEHGLILSGYPPTLHNNSTRRVIIYVRRTGVMRNGQTMFGTNVRDSLMSMRNNVFLAKIGQPTQSDHTIAPGGSQVVELSDFERGQGIVSLSLDAVVFDNGEFVGPDAGHSYDNILAPIRAERDLHQQVLADVAAGVDPWEKVRSIAATPNDAITGDGPQRLYMMKQRIGAKELLSIVQAPGGGVANALAMARSTEWYPTIWRGARQ